MTRRRAVRERKRRNREKRSPVLRRWEREWRHIQRERARNPWPDSIGGYGYPGVGFENPWYRG